MNVVSIQPSRKERGRIPQSTRFNVLRRDNFTCRYCGQMSPNVLLHLDHIKSIKDGGSDDESNLITACVDCNFGKGAKSLSIKPHVPSPPQANAAQPQERGLVGMWGHTFSDEEDGKKVICWQFEIIREITPELYLCQLFSWLHGGPTNCEIISLSKLTNECKLYATNAQMLDAAEKAAKHERQRG